MERLFLTLRRFSFGCPAFHTRQGEPLLTRVRPSAERGCVLPPGSSPESPVPPRAGVAGLGGKWEKCS